jgi:hypothetical protein
MVMNYKLFFFPHFCKYIQQIRDDCTSSVLVDVYNLIEFFFLLGLKSFGLITPETAEPLDSVPYSPCRVLRERERDFPSIPLTVAIRNSRFSAIDINAEHSRVWSTVAVYHPRSMETGNGNGARAASVFLGSDLRRI